MQAETKYAKRGDVHIAYRVIGDGPRDVVVVPGTVSHVELYWELPANAHLLRRLAAIARVIVFDKRGQGLSDRVGDQTIEERVGDVLAVMDAAGSRRATVYGWSEGGQLSLMLAATHPERVSGLVLYGTYASIKWPPWSVSREQIDRFLAAIEAHWGEGVLVRLNAPRRVHDKAFVQWFGRLERAVASPGAILTLMRANYEIDVGDLLPSIRVPTLVLHREGDALVPVEAGRYLARHIPGARYVELPGEDHMLQALDQELLDLMLDEIEEFMTGRRPRRAPAPALATSAPGDDAASAGAEIDDPGDAVAELERCREILACGDDASGLDGLVARTKAVAAAGRGDWRESEAQFVHAVETFRRYGMVWQEARTFQTWSHVLRSGARRSAALDRLEAAIAIHPRRRATDGPSRTVFRREGDYWTIAWNGNVVRLKDAKGLRHIAHLLANPGREFLACELAWTEGVPDERRRRVGDGDTPARLGDAGPVIDAKARDQYRRRIDDLQEELAEALGLNDTGRAERARAELESLRDHLSAAMGLAGRSRVAGSNAERARLMVTKAIKTAIAKIRAGDAALGRHLASSIKTGNRCAYDPGPGPAVAWEL